MRLIYFSPVPFSSYRQRPHYVVDALLRQGGIDTVTWVDPYPNRLPRLNDLLHRPAPHNANGTPIPEVQVVCAPAWPIEPLPGGPWLNSLRWTDLRRRLSDEASRGDLVLGIGRPSALANWALQNLSPMASFFDAMDDFPAFYGGLSARSMTRWENRIAAAVNLVIVSSSALEQKFSSRVPRVECRKILNGYPCQRLTRHPRPSRGRPVLGYIGSIASWFDWQVLIEMAISLPQAEIRLYGPSFAAVPDLPGNVRVCGPVDHQEAWRLACQFDIGIIPFALNPLTESVDPVKYYEYRAAGLPVWSTAFGEMKQRTGMDGVHVIRQGCDWQAALAEALAWDMPPDLRTCALEFDWGQRCAPLNAWLKHCAEQEIEEVN